MSKKRIYYLVYTAVGFVTAIGTIELVVAKCSFGHALAGVATLSVPILTICNLLGEFACQKRKRSLTARQLVFPFATVVEIVTVLAFLDADAIAAQVQIRAVTGYKTRNYWHFFNLF